MSKNRTATRRLAGFALALGLVVPLGGGVANAYEIASAPRETRDREPCSAASCWMYEFSCWFNGGTSETWEDGQGGYMTTCPEKEEEGRK